MIKAICLDLDGTLLTSEKEISKKTKAGLISLQEKGVKLILASGRTKKRMVSYGEELLINEYGGAIIESNGSAIYDYVDHQTKEIARLSRDEAEVLFQFLKKENVEIMVMGEEDCYICLAKGQTESHYLKTTNMEGLKNRNFFYIKSLEEVSESINKICVIESEEKIQFLFDRMSLLKDKYWYGRALPTWLEVGPINATKGNGLQLLAEKHGIGLDEIIAFGDGENDLSMLKLVKYGVAMENALDGVKSECNYVCGSCDEDGIIHFIENMEETK